MSVILIYRIVNCTTIILFYIPVFQSLMRFFIPDIWRNRHTYRMYVRIRIYIRPVINNFGIGIRNHL